MMITCFTLYYFVCFYPFETTNSCTFHIKMFTIWCLLTRLSITTNDFLFSGFVQYTFTPLSGWISNSDQPFLTVTSQQRDVLSIVDGPGQSRELTWQRRTGVNQSPMCCHVNKQQPGCLLSLATSAALSNQHPG